MSELTKIDEKLAMLFEERMKIVAGEAQNRRDCGLPATDAGEDIRHIANMISNKEIREYYVNFARALQDIAAKYEDRIVQGVRVAYCGVEGAFAYIAAKKLFPQGELVPYPDFASAYKSVENADCDLAVIPLENSYEGEVGPVMDLIFTGDLFINQILELPIVHNLIAPAGATIESIKTVVSHPQALGQCATFISENGYESKPYSNTAIAAKFVAESNDTSLAAIASEETAELFGLNILRREINDSRLNTTRFGVFSKACNEPDLTPQSAESFILVFTAKNQAGSLAQVLNLIGSHNFNMKCLRSRPMKELQWSYYFYIEAEGNIHSRSGQNLLRELSAICAKLKLVGTYK